MSSPIIMGRKTRARLENDEVEVIPATPEKGPKRRSILKREQRERENMEKEEKAKEKKEKEEKQEKEKEKGAKKLNFDTEHGAQSRPPTKAATTKSMRNWTESLGHLMKLNLSPSHSLQKRNSGRQFAKREATTKRRVPIRSWMKYLRFKSSCLFSVK